MKIIRYILGIIFLSKTCFAQDLYFHNPNVAQMYINSGYAGAENKTKAHILYQGFNSNLLQTTASHLIGAETRIINKVGLGLVGVFDNMSRGTTKNNQLNLLLNYSVKINKSTLLTPSVNYGYQIFTLNKTKLNYGDVINTRTGEIWNDNGQAVFKNPKIHDLGVGLLLQHTFFDFGIMMNHVTKPNIGFVSDIYLEKKLTLNSTIKIPIQEQILNCFIRYESQNNNNFLLLGINKIFYKKFVFGIGVHDIKYTYIQFGFKNNTIALNYSYSIDMKHLFGNFFSHELGVTTTFPKTNVLRKKY